MSKKSTKLKDMINEHYILGELPSSKLKKMKWNPVTGETMNEDDTNEYGGMSSSDEAAPKMKDSKETENIKKIFQMANLAKKGGGSGRYGKEFEQAKKKAVKALADMYKYSRIGG